MRCRSALTPGALAFIGSAMPRASAIAAKEDADPIVMQVPRERDMPSSASSNSACVMRPARSSSEKRHTSVPEPMSRPRSLPLSIGPEDTTMAGRLTLAAPIS